jgi:TPR repeat protein
MRGEHDRGATTGVVHRDRALNVSEWTMKRIAVKSELAWLVPLAAAVAVIGVVLALSSVGALPLSVRSISTVEGGIAALDQFDYQTARRIFTRLATTGNSRAAEWIGYMDENGLGAPPNPISAVHWYSTAANAGSAEAARRLGEMYWHGDLVPQDVLAARQWLKLGADEGDAIAARDLGEFEVAGIGAPKDSVQAYVWFDIAAVKGDAIAASARDRLLSVLPPAAVAEAEGMAKSTLAAMISPAEQPSTGKKSVAHGSTSVTQTSTASTSSDALS